MPAGPLSALIVWRRAAALAALALAANAQLELRMDKCATGNHTCSAIGSICADTDDSFRCTCRDGFAGNGNTCVSCEPIPHSVAISCSAADPSLSTAVACNDGYYRQVTENGSDTCDPVPPGPAPLPSPEPRLCCDDDAEADASGAFVLLMMMLMAAGIAVTLPVVCLACRARFCYDPPTGEAGL